MYKNTIIILFIIVIGIASCPMVNSSKPEKLDDWLKAENNMMKKRLILLERENSVLTDENGQYKADIHSQSEKIEKLTQEIESLRDQYRKDINQLDSQVKGLAEQNTVLQKESAQKIKELLQINKDNELKHADEIKRLNAEMVKQRDLFDQERTAMKNETAQKETACMQNIDELKSQIKNKDAVISSQKASYIEQSQRLEEMSKELQSKNKSVQLLEEQVNDLRRRLKIVEEAGKKESQGAGK